MNKNNDLNEYEGGATRSKKVDGLRYDLISPIGLKRLAKRYHVGAEKHGARNWEKGVPKEIVINHMFGHLVKYQEGNAFEDDLAAIAWNAFALMHYEDAEMRAQEEKNDQGYGSAPQNESEGP